jgi:hypothetical protein
MYVGTFAPDVLAAHPQYEALPLVIDVPGIALRGATTLALDDYDRPVAVRADATTLIAEPPPPAVDGTQPYVLVATTERRDGESVVRSSGNAARIEGFVLSFARCKSGDACNANGDCPAEDSCQLVGRGTGILTHFVRDYMIRGNAITGAGSFAIQHSAASGSTIRNLLTRNSPAGISYIGPTPGPSKVWQNTSTNLGGGMVLVCAGGEFTLPTVAHEGNLSVLPRPVDGSMNRTDVEISGNDFGHHIGFGLRILMFGFVPFPPGVADCSVTALRNRITDNAIGVVVDAGFPYQTRDGVDVDTAWTARFSGRFEGNAVEGSAENALVTLTRFTSTRDCRELDPKQPTSFRFLRNSTYTISTDGELATACYDNRELDPRSGQPLGNSLQIDGEPRTGLTCKQVVACD